MGEIDRVGLGIVGCGSARWMYAPILPLLRQGRVVAVADVDREAAEGLAAAAGARAYHGLDGLLSDPELDAVVIATPSWLHLEQTVEAARAGKHVLCEKPMARTVAECDGMIAAAEGAGVLLMVAHMKRFHKAFRRARQMIDDGRLGRVFHVRSDWDEPAHQWVHLGSRGSDLAWGGHFQDHGPHTIDLCIWWLGDAVRVQGTVRMVSPQMPVEDLAVCVVEHEGGAVSVHQTCIYTYRQWFETYELYGTEGTLVIDGRRHTSWSAEPPTMTLYHGPVPHIGDAGQPEYGTAVDVTPYNTANQLDETLTHHQYLLEIEHFCECIRTGARPIVTARDSRKTIEAINALYLSAYTGRAVDLPLADQPDLAAIFAHADEAGLRVSPGKPSPS